MNKRILIVSEYFYPEEFKINEVALDWKEKGYEVDVLTQNPTYPSGKVYPSFYNRWYTKETWNGINIYRVKAVTGYKESLFKKLLKYVTFMILGSIISLKIGKKYDYIFGFDVGALTGMLPAVLLNKFYKKDVTLWIQDIWPDSVYAYGFKKSRLLELFLDSFVKFVYKYTSSFAISCKGFESKIRPYLLKDKPIVYAPNWADELNQDLEKFSFSNDDKKHLTFAGNVGTVQNLDNIIAAFGTLPNEVLQNVQLNIIGDGSYLDTLKEIVNKHEYKSIVFWGRKPRNEMFKYFEASDFLIVSLINKPIFSLTVPAKTQTYIAAHKPILGIVNGEAAAIINENNLGFCAQPEDLKQIQAIIVKAINTTDQEVEQFTKNSEVLTNTVFDKSTIINTLYELLIGKRL